jgi:uncharacterized protein YndB with AHSA1/START domain
MDDAMTVTRELDLDIEADELWSLVSDGDRWADWLVGSADVAVVDGGGGTVVDDDGTNREVLVERVDPGRAVRFTWWPTGGPDCCSTVELVLVPRHTGSRLRVTEVQACAGSGLAWNVRVVALWCSASSLVAV